MKYRFNGKENTLAQGVYPDVPLAGENGARQKRDDARKLLARGVDPGAMKQAEKLVCHKVPGCWAQHTTGQSL